MEKTGFILVSHSEKLADGLKDILEEMNDGSIQILAAGGTGDGRVGTNAMRIMEAIEEASDNDQILIFCDLGSSVLSSEMAVEMLDEDIQNKTRLVDCPLVEGAFLSIVNAPNAKDTDELIAQAQEAREWKKIND